MLSPLWMEGNGRTNFQGRMAVIPAQGKFFGSIPSVSSSSPTNRLTTPDLALAALGIIYGDIGTSPLCTIKECFFGKHGMEVTPANVTGIMCLSEPP